MTSETLRLHYDGPRRFAATDRRHRKIAFRLETPGGIPAGARLRIVLGWFRSLIDNNPQQSNQWRDFWATVQGAGTVSVDRQPPKHFKDMAPAAVPELPGHFMIGGLTVGKALKPDDTLHFSVEGMLTHQAPIDARLLVQIATGGAAPFATIGEPVALLGEPGPTTGLVARLKSAPDKEGRFRLFVHGVDAYWNPSEPMIDPGALEVEVLGPGTLRGDRLEVGGDAPVRVRVRDPRRGFEARSNPVRREGFGGERVYFGGIHWHSRHADGDRPTSEGYAYARDVLGLDFAAVTDHSPKPIWEEALQVNEAFHAPRRFVTVPAWEWSTSTGHSNIYLRSPEVPGGPARCHPGGHPGGTAWPDEAILVPHHTNIVSGELKEDGSHYWREFNWDLPNQRVRLVEIAQTRGNFEADELDADWGIVTADIGASVRDALAKGYRLGFVGGTDNHTGFPTRDPEMGRGFGGMACVLAGELTREAIWDAMDARRTYATSGVPILAHWTVNGHRMGEAGEVPGGRVRFSAELFGTAPIERVEVVADGKVVWRHHPDGQDVILAEESLPAPGRDGSYYYLRLRQHDGHRAWLSPVWLTPR